MDLVETAIRNAEQDAGLPNPARKIDTLSEEFVGKRGKVEVIDGFNIFKP